MIPIIRLMLHSSDKWRIERRRLSSRLAAADAEGLGKKSRASTIGKLLVAASSDPLHCRWADGLGIVSCSSSSVKRMKKPVGVAWATCRRYVVQVS